MFLRRFSVICFYDSYVTITDMTPKGKKQKNEKIRVAVLMGGPSTEHEVSLKTGANILEHFDPEQFEAKGVVISKEGKWPFAVEELPQKFDVAFIAMHGTYGEDGTVQGILDEVSIPYTGSGKLSSALGMNKFLSLRLFKDAGLTIPPTLHFILRDFPEREEEVMQNILWYLEKPWVVKPNYGGSSVGTVIINDKEALRDVLRAAANDYKDALVQTCIPGREVTCGVVDYGTEDSAFALPPTEIVPRASRFFDYKAKYEPGGSDEITPARFPESFLKEFRRIALLTHRLTGCRGFSRTDMIVGKDKKIYLLEINTIPGLTKESLLPKAAHVYGIPFQKLLELLVESAFASHKRKS